MDTLAQMEKECGFPRYRGQIEYIQSQYLAPFATKVAREGSRRFEEQTYNYETRSEFQRDRDRIIHSKAFRRLLYKTQVFVNHEGDHYRTRMTHSLEVAQIARGIARSLGVNEDLVEAIALGHDLGHTPFGHAVEKLLSDLLKDEHGFFHNEQSVRIVDHIEIKKGLENKLGLNLTWEVREGILKHNNDRTFGIYDSLEPDRPSGIEGQIVALVDTVAYVCHDLDDGLEAGLFDDAVRYGLLSKHDIEILWDMFDAGFENGVSSIINRLVKDIVDSTWHVLRDNNIDSIGKVRAFKDKATDDRVVRLEKYRESFNKLKGFVCKYVYGSTMTSIMDTKAKKFIREIYESYYKNPEQLPSDVYKSFGDALKACDKGDVNGGGKDDLNDGYRITPSRVLCDFIASMTDRYALETYDRLFNPHIKI